MMKTMPECKQLHVEVHHEDGAFWATVDEFPGIFATGDDLSELRESLQEGISLMLAGPGLEPPVVTVGELHLEPETMSAGVELVYA
jgi:predicted RNase H-like HicB family nuclease